MWSLIHSQGRVAMETWNLECLKKATGSLGRLGVLLFVPACTFGLYFTQVWMTRYVRGGSENTLRRQRRVGAELGETGFRAS
jgi:hypothetical protein